MEMEARDTLALLARALPSALPGKSGCQWVQLYSFFKK
jgi:hypothetical protein